MSEAGRPRTVRDLFRRHERGLAVVWLLATAFLGLVVVVGPVRAAVLDHAQVALDWWEGRWTQRLLEGQRLVSEGRFEEAAPYLARLDEIHPARNARHKLGLEREYLLRLLARSYEALDRRSLTIETYERLVAFDPNHYRNYFELAQALDRLRSRATMAPEARDAYAAALEILPVHLPSVRGYLTYYLDRSEFIPAVEGYERYLDAYLNQQVQVGLGEARVELPVLVDGRIRSYEIPLVSEVSDGDTLTIGTGGFAMALERVEVRPAARAGIAVSTDPFSVDVSMPTLVDLVPAEHGSYRSTGEGSMVEVALPDFVGDVGRLEIRIALFKPVDADLWSAVEKSYENLLDEEGRADAAARTVTFPSAEGADAVLGRLGWAQAALFRPPVEVSN